MHVYTDGSVHLNHGGIEMGQGLMTKISQIASNEFGIPIKEIKITSTDTEKVPNTSASAASATTDINGGAVIDAIKKIKNNLGKFIKKEFNYKGKRFTGRHWWGTKSESLEEPNSVDPLIEDEAKIYAKEMGLMTRLNSSRTGTSLILSLIHI